MGCSIKIFFIMTHNPQISYSLKANDLSQQGVYVSLMTISSILMFLRLLPSFIPIQLISKSYWKQPIENQNKQVKKKTELQKNRKLYDAFIYLIEVKRPYFLFFIWFQIIFKKIYNTLTLIQDYFWTVKRSCRYNRGQVKLKMKEKMAILSDDDIGHGINKYNTILITMKLMYEQDQHKISDTGITGWEEGVLLPRNSNISQMNTFYTKALTHINRKQFIQRRRKNEALNNIQNCQPHHQDHHPFQPKIKLEKKYSTINNDKFSSINQLRQQMENIQKIKDRWQQVFINNEANQRSKNNSKITQSGLIKAQQDCFDEQNPQFDITKLYLRQTKSCRSNRKRPISSSRANENTSITLSEKDNQRSKTIHSRGSSRFLSCRNRNLKLISKSNKLNITINQIQGKKMQSILKILWNHT